MRISDKNFFLVSADKLAVDLLGKFLCRKTSDGIKSYEITETECYMGENDSACHASKGRTKRTETFYMEGGTIYTYLIYGMYTMLNIVAGDINEPQAVLIRGLDGIKGPGRLTKTLDITCNYNGIDIKTSDDIWIEDRGMKISYTCDKRVGIDYAKQIDIDRLWRFIKK